MGNCSIRASVSIVIGCIVGLVGACSDEDSGFNEGLSVICNAPVDCQDCDHALWAGRMTLLAAHIYPRLSDDAAVEFFDGMIPLSFTDRAEALRVAATEAGISECPMVEAYRAAEHGDDGTRTGDSLFGQ